MVKKPALAVRGETPHKAREESGVAQKHSGVSTRGRERGEGYLFMAASLSLMGLVSKCKAVSHQGRRGTVPNTYPANTSYTC